MSIIVADAAVRATAEYNESLNHHLELAKKLMAKFEEKCKAANVQYIIPYDF